MRSVRDITRLENIPVLVRAALNTPYDHGKVANAYRLRRSIATLQYLADRHARVIVVSHEGEKGTETLRPVAEALATLLPNVSFCPENTGPVVREAVRTLLPGHILVLENLRRNKGETANDSAFVSELATLADLFVEDAFDTCHRLHASIVGVPKILPCYAGLVLEEEITALNAALVPKRPAVAIIGGAKFSTKEGVITKLLDTYDHVVMGGALANDFLKMSGANVGKSLVASEESLKMKELLQNPKLILPIDAIVVSATALPHPSPKESRVADVRAIGDNDIILDIGPATRTLVATHIAQAQSVLWNGPMGNYENGFVDGTDTIALAIASGGAHSVVGGGDTITSIEKLGILSKFSFVSTGGGAMLDYLAKGTLPGIEALDNS